MRLLQNQFSIRYSLLMTLLLMLFASWGCSSASEDTVYTNPDFGIRLEKPENWSLVFTERNGSIVLETENEEKESARIGIYGFACVPSQYENSKNVLEAELERSNAAYDLESVTIIQEPIQEQINGYQVATAIISLPTIALQENSSINQFGLQDPDVDQIIEMIAIRDNENNSIIVYAYQGRSDKLNTEAEKIIDSIELTCTTDQYLNFVQK
ncbi:MAG: hypothetical protein H6656_20225 [Ardenticatenaceae bacterium]|nr:hypothetical protein [Anaerolineales bacterium]MCB9009658.1 hypothetical protein [Ardenticatenaceae bacterium]